MFYNVALVSTVQQSESAITIHIFSLFWISFPFRSPRVAQLVKNQPANAGDTRDLGSIPGSGRSPGGGNGNSSFLASKIPRAEELGGLQSMGSQRVGCDGAQQQHGSPQSTE